jgi:hypothetical protein
MRNPTSEYLSSVLSAAERPCVSIYLPTHRVNGSAIGGPPDQENRGRFRDLADRAEKVLVKSHSGLVASGIAEHLHRLRTDDSFWNAVQDGAAILASPDRFDAFTLPRTVPEYVEVGESFHVKPLLRFVQSAEPFHVLGVSHERVALFHGNRYDLRALSVAGIPLAMTDALGTETDQPVRQFHTGGPAAVARSGHGGHGAKIQDGQESRKDEAGLDTHRFYQIVDREVIRRVSEPSGLPLILAGTDDNLAEFRVVSKNRFLAAGAVHGDWTKLSLPEIRERAWKVFEAHYLERLSKIREDFGTAVSRGRGTAELADAARAAAAGRVGVLLIDADRSIPGTIDAASGAAKPSAAGAATGDMLDDLAELGMKTKAEVIVTPSAQMPTKTGLAAIYRY